MIVNLTLHPVTIFLPDGEPLRLPKAEVDARVAETWEPLPPITVDGRTVPRAAALRGEVVENLPDPRPGVFYFVSGMVLDHPATWHRSDLVAPGPVKRDDQGRIIGSDGLRWRDASKLDPRREMAPDSLGVFTGCTGTQKTGRYAMIAAIGPDRGQFFDLMLTRQQTETLRDELTETLERN